LSIKPSVGAIGQKMKKIAGKIRPHYPSQSPVEEIETLSLKGLNSGTPIQVDPDFCAEQHRRLGERLKQTGTR
jgi:hypothetical protein